MVQAVLPTGRLFGRVSRKELNKKWRGRTNLGPILNKKGRKGAELKKIVYLLSNSREVQEM